MTGEMTRNVMVDTTSSGHARITCLHCAKALVHQPFMDDERWKRDSDRFLRKHRKCAKAKKEE